MNTRSIRFRLTVWYTLVLTAGLALFSGLIWFSLSHQLDAELNSELNGRANRLEAYFREEVHEVAGAHLRAELVEFSRAFGPGSYVAIEGPDGFAFRYPVDTLRPAKDARILQRSFTADGRRYILAVEISTSEMNRTLNVLRGLLLWLLPIVIVIASVGGAIMSGRALRPVIDFTEAASSISIENLSERLPLSNTGDELDRLAATLNRMLARLENAVTTLSQFAADASHEFRTPLAVLQTTVELALRRPRTAGEYRQALEEVSGDIVRMTRLVEDLLALARTDTGAAEVPRSAVDICSVLEDVLAQAGPLSELRQVGILPLESPGPVWISGNRAALNRLFLVLVDNGLKYSHSGGDVGVAVLVKDSTVAVTVRDYGSGIAPEHLPHIFKRFYRGDPARTGGGHGLGLALAQSIATCHGARITATSIEGQATEFRVEFALGAAPADSSGNLQLPALRSHRSS